MMILYCLQAHNQLSLLAYYLIKFADSQMKHEADLFVYFIIFISFDS